MSLLINGMDMPKNCLLCPCCVGEGTGMGRQHYCQAIDDEPYVSEDYRPKNCPLAEIPTPHGDLIDRDDLLAYFERKSKGKTAEEALKLLYTALKAYPTVIEKEMN